MTAHIPLTLAAIFQSHEADLRGEYQVKVILDDGSQAIIGHMLFDDENSYLALYPHEYQSKVIESPHDPMSEGE